MKIFLKLLVLSLSLTFINALYYFLPYTNISIITCSYHTTSWPSLHPSLGWWRGRVPEKKRDTDFDNKDNCYVWLAGTDLGPSYSLYFSGGRSCLGASPSSLLLTSPSTSSLHHHHHLHTSPAPPPPPPPSSSSSQQQQQQQCPHCLKMLSSRQSLLRHIEDRHVVTQPYRCAICGSMCKTKNALQKHHYTYHRGFPLRIVWSDL